MNCNNFVLGDEIERILKEIHEPWSGGALPFRVTRDQAANGKKGVRQFFEPGPPRALYDGNDCICHVMDREFKVALKDGPLGPLFAQQHKIVAYFKKSNKAANYLQQAQLDKLRDNSQYFAERIAALGWDAGDSWLDVKPSNKPLKVKISMPVRWWSDVDQNTRYILIEEPIMEAQSKIRKDLKKKANKEEKREMLKFRERDLEALRKAVPILYPVKLAIKELEGNIYLYFLSILFSSRYMFILDS